MVDFNQVPIDLRVPGQYIEIDNTQAVRGLPGMPSRLLVLGQRLGGTATTHQPVDVLSADQAAALFGRGSMLHQAIAALKTANRWTKCTVIPLEDDGAAAKASGSILFTGTVTASGTIALLVGGRRVRVGAAAGDTAAEVANATVAAINANADLAVTAAVDGAETAQVNLTARHGGEAGNGIDVRLNYYMGEVMPAGINATVTPMAGGTANPDIGGAIAAMAATWYTDIVMPYTDAANLVALETELARRHGPTVQQDSVAYGFSSGTHADLTTLGNSRNSPFAYLAGMKRLPSTPWEAAATVAGVAAYYTHLDPARPLQTLPLPGILPPAEEDQFDLEERNLLLFDGMGSLRVDDGGRVLIERLISTYETNAYGFDDVSYLDLMTLKTLAYIRYTERARIAMRFPRHKLADDGTRVRPGQAIVTPSTIRAELIALAGDWEAAGLVENIAQFKADLIVERDENDRNRVNALNPPDLVNQFRVFAGSIQFRL